MEIAHLDENNLPISTHDEWLPNLNTVFSGDTAHSHINVPLNSAVPDLNFSVRISKFDIVGEEALTDFCRGLGTTANTNKSQVDVIPVGGAAY